MSFCRLSIFWICWSKSGRHKQMCMGTVWSWGKRSRATCDERDSVIGMDFCRDVNQTPAEESMLCVVVPIVVCIGGVTIAGMGLG